MKRLLGFFLVVALFAISGALHFALPAGELEQTALSLVTQNSQSDTSLSYNAPAIEKIPPQKEREAALLFVGDIMLDRAVRGAVERRGGDYQFLFQNIVWPKRDITFANLEGAAARTGANQGSIYSFRMNPDSLFTLAQNGFAVLSVANNHIGDWGAAAASETVQNIYDAGMESSGWGYTTTSDALVITERNGVRIGFIAFSEFNSGGAATETRKGILLATAPYFEPMIREAAKQVDVLVVSLHAGIEYQTFPSKLQESLAHKAIDAGARIVMGHHPHVVQPVVEYNNGLIAYSLGNFIFDQSFSSETTSGGALLATYNADKNTLTYQFGKSIQGSAFQLEKIEWEEAQKTIHF